jgi:hypothetical protein
MQIYSTGTKPPRGAEVICRQTRWNLLLLLAILWVIPVGMWYLSVPGWVMVLGLILPVLCTWPMLGSWSKRGRADNWVLVVHAKGIWLNLQNVDCCEAAEGQTVVQLSFNEVASAGRVVERYKVPSGNGGKTHHCNVYLALQVAPEIGQAVGRAIEEERARPLPERVYFGGLMKVRSKATLWLIDVLADERIRIKFSTAQLSLTPGIKRALAALGEYVEVEDEERLSLPDWRELEDEDLDTVVRGLVTNGQNIDAIELLKRRMKISTTEAKMLVDEMKTVKSV